MADVPDDDQPGEYDMDTFAPDEFDSPPADASPETTGLYVFAVVVQIGQLIVSAWGFNRLSKPGISTPEAIFTVVVLIGAIVACWWAWSEAYHSAARDTYGY